MFEKFCLKWNDFQANVSRSFGILRNENHLHDVTLVTDNHEKVPAHRLVLSACSDYFKDIFKNNQHSHLLLCLDGISSQDLKNIMDYIYNGEVQIYQDDLDRFLVVAQRLKLEGLMGGKVEDNMENNDIKDEFDESVKEDNSISKIIEKQSTETKVIKERRELIPRNTTVALNPEENIGFDKQVLQYLEECSDGSYKCTACGKTSDNERGGKSKQKFNMKKHIETHLDGLSYSCPFCEKTFRSRNLLSWHKYVHHK